MSDYRIDEEPDWFASKLNSRRISYVPAITFSSDTPPVLQDDFLKPFLFDIGNFGLYYAYKKYYSDSDDPDKYKYTKTNHPRRVIIIGAGMSGLVCGYELAQAGHEVLILEMQYRVGGRVKTVAAGKFFKGLWADVGAMREPGTGKPDWVGPSHFMTDFYTQKFQLPVTEFVQYNDQTFYSFYGEAPIKRADWINNPTKYCNEFWPEWKKNVKPGIEISDINEYTAKTFEPIKLQLYKFLETDPLNAWSKWIQKWSKFTIYALLRSSLEEIITLLKESETYKSSDETDLKSLSGLLPWSVDAVTGLATLSGNINFFDVSVPEFLRGEFGKYFNGPMHTFKDGLETLPLSFMEKNRWGWNEEVDLSQNVKFGVTVDEIQYLNDSVTVLCHNETNKKAEEYNGDRVIVTVPLNITRQIKFTPPLPKKYYKAMTNIHQAPSTKILLQCRTRFWEAQGIQGGATATDLPISLIVYPSNPGFEIPMSQRGILMCYSTSDNAMLFGSRTHEDAIAEAIKEVATIHPEIEQYFEVGAVQSWNDDPSAQGAFCVLKPEQDLAKEILLYPHQSVYFCGEALSNCNAWIQGAILSGMRSAYQLFARNELNYNLTNKTDSTK